jgi:hypothetical protein
VENAGIKGISPDDLMCQDVFIPLKTLMGAFAVSKYACHRQRSLGRQLSYQGFVISKRLGISCGLKEPIPETSIEPSGVLRIIIILNGIYRRIECVIKVIIEHFS